MSTADKKLPAVPVDIEQVGPAVIALQSAVAGMRSKVKDKLIVLMLNDMTGIGKREIQSLLDAIPEIARVYLKVKS